MTRRTPSRSREQRSPRRQEQRDRRRESDRRRGAGVSVPGPVSGPVAVPGALATARFGRPARLPRVDGGESAVAERRHERRERGPPPRTASAARRSTRSPAEHREDHGPLGPFRALGDSGDVDSDRQHAAVRLLGVVEVADHVFAPKATPRLDADAPAEHLGRGRAGGLRLLCRRRVALGRPAGRDADVSEAQVQAAGLDDGPDGTVVPEPIVVVTRPDREDKAGALRQDRRRRKDRQQPVGPALADRARCNGHSGRSERLRSGSTRTNGGTACTPRRCRADSRRTTGRRSENRVAAAATRRWGGGGGGRRRRPGPSRRRPEPPGWLRGGESGVGRPGACGSARSSARCSLRNGLPSTGVAAARARTAAGRTGRRPLPVLGVLPGRRSCR
ncbi:t121.1 [Tupaiid betaherpesvirus 1]|uniref:T121.1 n=1 Tax=Tupaiid herpesvirus 1 (strain 1) TaxID=10397 RepID=Q91TH9_TUHV1|nr:t121.1 [Tupaiid betaherpesvirus 1]AAK57168.1 t121.1 [Tupaiid betaherpesvirus 1]